MTYPAAPSRDPFLHKSFETIKYVHDNMDAIRKVASHLVPVSDLEDFQIEIEAVYSRLGLLVEASELIVQATEAGMNLLTAESPAVQRSFLELGTAALHSTSYFASAADFLVLKEAVTALTAVVDGIVLEMADFVRRGDFDGTMADLLARLLAVENRVDDLEALIQGIEEGLGNGSYFGDIEGTLVLIQDRLTNVEGTQTGFSEAIFAITSRVEENELGMEALSQSFLGLVSQISNLETGMEGIATATQVLTTRVNTIDEDIISLSTLVTTLTAQVTDAHGQIDTMAVALQAVETLAQNTAAGQLAMASAITQLNSRVADAESQTAAVASGLTSLTTRVEQTEDGLSLIAEDITHLQASITGTGNLLTNATFESGVTGWTLFSRGAGWLAAELGTNLEPERLPLETHSLSLMPAGVPSGSAGIRAANVPAEALSGYILSGYLAAENCTLRLEWRLFDADMTQIGMGLAGEVTDTPPANNIQGWERHHTVIPVPSDGAVLQVQAWVVDAHDAVPKAWLLMPMLERQVGGQTSPSPWVPGMASDMTSVFADALETLTVRVEQTEEDILAVAQQQTELNARIGSLSEWRVTTHMTSDEWDDPSVNAPYPATLRLVNGDPVHTFERGLTLVRFTEDGELDTATRYDTYSTASQRTALAAALDALGPTDGFLLVAQNHHGIKHPDLTAAMRRCGANIFENVTGSRAYALIGCGGIGPGGGIEYVGVADRDWIDFTFSLVNDVFKDLGSLSGVQEGIAIQAGAIQTLEVRVEQNEQDISTSAGFITDLQLDYVNLQGDVAANTSAVDSLTTSISDIEGDLSLLSGSVTTLSGRIDDIDGELVGLSTAIDTLEISLTQVGDDIAANAQAITDLDVVVAGKADASALNDLTSRVEVTEDGIEALGTDLSLVSARIREMPDNLIRKPRFEDGSRGDWTSGVLIGISDLPQATIGLRINASVYEGTTAEAFPASPGEQFEFSAWINTTSRSGTGSVRLSLHCVTKDGTNAGFPEAAFVLNSVNGWTHVSGIVTASAATARARPLINVAGGSGTAVIADLRITRISQAQQGMAEAANLLEARVTSNEQGVTAHAADITSLRVAAGLELAPGKNLLQNPTARLGTAGWELTTAVAASTLNAEMDGANPIFRVSNGAATGNRNVFQNVFHPELPGKTVTFSADVWVSGSTVGSVGVDLIGLNANNSPVWFPGGPTTVPSQGAYHRVSKTLTLPSDVVGLRCRVHCIQGNYATFRFKNAKLEIGSPATAYSDDQPYASATQMLQVTSSQLVDGQTSLMAKYSMDLDVNGYSVGLEFNNDGSKSDLKFRTDTFQIGDPSGLWGYTCEEGISIWRKGGFMAVMGPGFGMGNEFIYWYGPDFPNLNSCTRATGIRWDTINGLSYSKGAMFSGTLTAGGQTKSLSATSYTTGAFGTNGGPIVVNASFAHYRRQHAGITGSTKNTMSAGTGTTAAAIQLWRKVGTGAFTMVGSASITGTLDIVVDPDPSIETIAHWNNVGAITYTDNAGGTQNREYELRVVSESYRNVTISGSAPIPAPINERLLGTLTSE